MADFDFDDREEFPRFPLIQTQRVVNIAGAVCSLGLVIGVLVWGYNLAVRDVSGVPVIRAAEGPLRIAPPNPGGTVADHQGMAVNAIPELGAAEPLPEQIILAPEPVQLGLDDAPGLAEEVPPLVVEANAATATGVGVDPLGAPQDLASAAMIGLSDQATEGASIGLQPIEEPVNAVELALAEALGLDASGLSGIENTVAGVSGDGLQRSLRPLPRPTSKRLTVAAAAAAPAAREVDPATLTVGTRLVQLGAFDTTETARAEWAALAVRFGDLMSGKSMVLQPAESGGRTFYRLRATGFEGEDDARRFCSALDAEDASCVPVVHR